MSRGVNKAILLGYVGKTPEVKNIGDDRKVARFTLATTKRWKKNGEEKEHTEWHRCVVWGNLASIVEQHVTKGAQLYVEGEIQTHDYEKDGVKRYATEINVEKVIFVGSKRDGESSSRPATAPAPQPAAAAAGAKFDDDDIPF